MTDELNCMEIPIESDNSEESVLLFSIYLLIQCSPFTIWGINL